MGRTLGFLTCFGNIKPITPAFAKERAVDYTKPVSIDLPDEYVPVTIRALENYAAYMRATNRDQGPAHAAAEVFRAAERRGPDREYAKPPAKKRRA